MVFQSYIKKTFGKLEDICIYIWISFWICIILVVLDIPQRDLQGLTKVPFCLLSLAISQK